METEKLEIVSQMQRLESDKLAMEQAMRSYEHDKSYQQEIQKYQKDLKVVELQKDLELQKEEARNEMAKSRHESDKIVIELKAMYDKEIESLKNQTFQMQEKIRNQASRLDSFREESNPKMLEIRIEELENELEYYKTALKEKKKEEHDSIFLSSREDI